MFLDGKFAEEGWVRPGTEQQKAEVTADMPQEPEHKQRDTMLASQMEAKIVVEEKQEQQSHQPNEQKKQQTQAKV